MLSVVIPTYKRARSIGEVQSILCHHLDELSMDYEIIWVDDASCDGTDLVLKTLAKESSKAKSVILAKNSGQQNASLAGIRMAEGDLIMTMDDDLRYSPESIEDLCAKMAAGYDVVYGVPPRQNNGLVRHFGSDVKEWLFRILCGKPKEVTLTSYRVMTREVADWVCEDCVSNVYLSARILQRFRRIGTVAVSDGTGMNLPSNYTFRKLASLLWHVFRNYTKIGALAGLVETGPQYVLKETVN